MTTPNIVPVKWNGNSLDYLKTKVDHSGAERGQRTIVSVPTGTTTTTIVGLVPFNAGEQINGFRVVSDALGTGVTVSLGVIYDDNVNNTNNQTLFVNASTAPAAGGEVVYTPSATSVTYVTTGNGWFAATIGGATTGSTGNIQGVVSSFYDGSASVTPN